MGYDMHWRKKDDSEEAAVAAARKVWDAAIAERNALPDGEQGQFNRAKFEAAGNDLDAHEVYDGRTGRYIAAQDKVMAASRAMDAAEQSYFRLNIRGMSLWCDVMYEPGMAFEDDEHPPWPKAEDYGLTQEQAWAAMDPEEYPGTDLTPQMLEAGKRMNAENDRILAWHGKADTPGIPLHKFSSNDGWIVLPVECEAALRIYTAKLDEIGADTMHNFIGNKIGNRGRWAQWLAYLNGAITHDGFEVR